MGQFFSRETDLFYGKHEVAEVDQEEMSGEEEMSVEDEKTGLEEKAAEEKKSGEDEKFGEEEKSGEDEKTTEKSTAEKSLNSKTKSSKDPYENCTKTFNGHRDMIRIKNFTTDSLPDPYNKIEDVYKLTMALVYLTVRIKTKCVSSKRPDFMPDTKKECSYPLSEKRGEKCYSTGTGRVCDVVTHRGRKCTCTDCSKSQTPNKNCWTIKVFTATHVVFDGEEAADAICTLFYDDNDNTDRNKYLRGFKKIWSDSGGDLCLLSTVTCDEGLSTKLFAKIREFNSYWKSLKKLHEKQKSKERLVILVSHPHGKEKRISVGFGLDIGAIQGLRYSKFIYNSPTCPGTSGGPVYVLGYDWFATEFVHGGGMNDFTDIENIFKSNPDLITKLFPSYQSGSPIIPLSYSSAYYTDEKNSDTSQDKIETAQSANVDPKFKFSNYSARWY
ncbi:uncharacterized protein LOC106050702 [Biomphalaria glabrata]|uniref:Uncharacterized protein LOC106050702 n=1 Tax=Biomphalaria glabrata TaxID=6526 RepID=A0A9W2YTY8_BIOGL|nr:uncharacterized protein LOC106050702 [Biomphalaria glabrata]